MIPQLLHKAVCRETPQAEPRIELLYALVSRESA